MSTIEEYATRIRERFPEALTDTRTDLGTHVLVVRPADVVGVLETLRDGFSFDHLSDLSAVDWHPREPRYEVNYHLYSIADDVRIRVKAPLADDDPRIPTATGLWPTADWHEREVYDFFGITFDGHPNLTRILMPPEWIGHPLRKDYPVGGVPVEFKMEPAYVGDKVVSPEARPAAGGVPGRLHRDRGLASRWTWTGAPASGVRIPSEPQAPEDADASSEGEIG